MTQKVIGKMQPSCHNLPLANYCNLNIYGLSITTGQDAFEPVLDSRYIKPDRLRDSQYISFFLNSIEDRFLRYS
jgi:hypothetical protein